jgi:cell wall-associated NlpC family hydrolase
LARPAGADQLSSVQAQANALEARIQQTGSEISALSQQYDAAQYHLGQIQEQVSKTQDAIVKTKEKVAADKASLRHAAIESYVTTGTTANSNPLFDSNTRDYAAKAQYGQVAAGKLSTAVANLTNSKDRLDAQQAQLQTQKSAAQSATASAAGAVQRAQVLQQQQNANLSQVKGQIATLIDQKRAADAAAAAVTARQAIAQAKANPVVTSDSSPPIPVPPSSGGIGGAAVAAAESQIGVPYVWGGSSPSGFDCSGLTMWAYAQVGISLPHFSGAQMSGSTPVPISALEPGDLLFYGPGGSEHVAMYVGGGMMIEAPRTGSSVRISPMRLDSGFVGARRP